jgi:beta-xylosidase
MTLGGADFARGLESGEAIVNRHGDHQRHAGGRGSEDVPGGHSRRRALATGLGVAAGSVVFGALDRTAAARVATTGRASAGSSVMPGELPWTADQGDGTYRNPVLNADWSDPDAVRVGGHFYMTASTFNRIPGLPILRSRDLVNWTIIGHALAELEPHDVFAVPQHGNGVWAPALRYHDGRFWIIYPDPDYGIFVTTAVDPAGPWTTPHALKPGKGFIDPCPLWDSDGQAYLIHAYAKSRAGINNILTLHRISPDGTRLLDEGQVVVDGNQLPGYTTLEGPKLYKRDDWYWIFAPAGGVTHGWQSAFRSRSIFGPYEDRIVLAQGDTTINGPHQGAWVTTRSGEDWFLHFQDRGPYGRVVHLQPMQWRTDGWPVMGVDDGTGQGSPVLVHRKPDVPGRTRITAPAGSDDFAGHTPGLQWTWQANAAPAWASVRAGRLSLVCVPSANSADLRLLPNVLGQRFPAESFVATTSMTLRTPSPGAHAGLVVLGDAYAWIGLQQIDSQPTLVYRTAATGEAEGDAVAPMPLPPGVTSVRLRVTVAPSALCSFAADIGTGMVPIGPSFTPAPAKWIGTTLGLFGTAPPAGGGTAEFSWLEVAPG